MMNILKKFKFDNSTYLFILLYFICGFIKNIMIIYLIVIIHELGHFFIAKLCNYKINKVTIYPFGGITETETLINSPLKKDFFVFNGGFIFQLALFFLILVFYKNNLISNSFYNLFIKYNKFIFLFNLIPIIPLDGYLILNNLLNNVLSYYKSLQISFVISIISLCLFLYFYKENYVIIGFLVYNSIIYLKNIKIFYKRFILERYLYDLTFDKIKYFNEINLHKLTRDCFCYFKNDNSYTSEKKLLNKKFDNIRSFW